MPLPQYEIHADPPALFRAAGEKFAQIANDAVKKQGAFFVGLAGGTTPRGFYLLLAQEGWRARVPWLQTHIFFGDERCVPPDHPDSNYRMAREALIERINVPEGNVHRMFGEDEPHAAAAAYEAEITRAFAQSGIKQPVCDLILLGIGPDGHTASLFPDTAALLEQKKLVMANYVEKFNSFRLTMTLPMLNRARNVLFLVSGEGKAAIINEIFMKWDRRFQYPAELVQPADGRLLWMLDRAAAAPMQASAG